MSALTFSVLVTVLVSCINLAYSGNILALMGIASPSHHMWNGVLLKALADRGHNVTVLTPDITHSPKCTKINYIHLEQTYKTRAKQIDFNQLIEANYFQTIPYFYQLGYSTCEGIVKSKGLKTLLNCSNSTQFDLILYEYTSGPCLLGFLHEFNYPPLIGITAFHNPPNTVDLVSSHHYPAYIPFFAMPYDVDMCFWQRVYNTMMYVADELYRIHIYTPSLDGLVRPLFSKNMPYLGDLEKNTAIVFVNSHPAVNYPQPLPPNIIEVGGMQLLNPDPLPENVAEFIKGSPRGAILISLGTNMMSKELGIERCKVFLDVISMFPEYNFLWKFDDNLKSLSLPENVLIKSFFPQKDILADIGVKAFVTHAGSLSIQEATWYGVPLVGIALFIDQKRNLHKSFKLGVAKVVDYNDLNVEILYDAIKNVLEDPMYRKNMEIRSKRFRNRPVGALDTAIWWTEYIMTNPESDYLKSPRLSFWHAQCLDIFFSFVAVFVIAIVILYNIFKLAFQKKGKMISKGKKHQ